MLVVKVHYLWCDRNTEFGTNALDKTFVVNKLKANNLGYLDAYY